MTFSERCEIAANCLNRLRIIPRILVLGYFWMMAKTWIWATGLPDLSMNQMAFAAAVFAAGPPIFAFYYGRSTKDGDK